MSVRNLKDTLTIKASIACDVCDKGNAVEYVPTHPPINGADLLHASCENCKEKSAVPNYVCEAVINHVLQAEGVRLVIDNASDLQTFANGKYVSFDEFTVWHIQQVAAGEQSFVDSVRERVRFAGRLN